MSGKKKRKVVFDREVGKAEYADALGMGAVRTGEDIDCVHISFGQLQPGKKEEKEEEIVEYCEPIAHIILSKNAARLLLKKLKDITGEKEGGD